MSQLSSIALLTPWARARPRVFSGVPKWMLLPAVVGLSVVMIPLVAIVARVDWTHFLDLISTQSSREALGLSLRTSIASTVLCLILGIPMAMVLAREHFPGQRLIRSIVLLPLVLPPVVGGVALLYTFGRQGLLAPVLDVFGISVAFSTGAVVLAQTFVSLPFLVLSLEGTLRSVGRRYELVAATLGARPSTVLRSITVPLIMPGLASGAVLAFARALGEFGATMTFAGNLQGVTRTLPLEIYLQRVTDQDAAVALSLVLVIVATVVTVVTAAIADRTRA